VLRARYTVSKTPPCGYAAKPEKLLERERLTTFIGQSDEASEVYP
jgi:hypothetical protein